MEYLSIPGLEGRVSRISLGTWAIGGWMWGGTEEEQSLKTVQAALDAGINLIDTAPVYGFGQSEVLVGKAIARTQRQQVYLSTKAGLAWQEGRVYRDGSRERLLKEVEDSLARLNTDYLDIYYVHWPDCRRPIRETARAMRELHEQGVIKAVGVSNFTQDQMEAFRAECPLHVCQPPYNIFERGIEQEIKPYCERQGIALMTYGALCRGLLSGKMSKERRFGGDDLRQMDPKFQEPRLSRYLAAAERLGALARDSFGRSLLAFAVRWVLEKGVPITIWGARRPEQLEALAEVWGWSMDLSFLSAVDGILAEEISAPVGPEFMAPPSGLAG